MSMCLYIVCVNGYPWVSIFMHIGGFDPNQITRFLASLTKDDAVPYHRSGLVRVKWATCRDEEHQRVVLGW